MGRDAPDAGAFIFLTVNPIWGRLQLVFLPNIQFRGLKQQLQRFTSDVNISVILIGYTVIVLNTLKKIMLKAFVGRDF